MPLTDFQKQLQTSYRGYKNKTGHMYV